MAKQNVRPLLGGERTYGRHSEIDAVDPERTSAPIFGDDDVPGGIDDDDDPDWDKEPF